MSTTITVPIRAVTAPVSLDRAGFARRRADRPISAIPPRERAALAMIDAPGPFGPNPTQGFAPRVLRGPICPIPNPRTDRRGASGLAGAQAAT